MPENQLGKRMIKSMLTAVALVLAMPALAAEPVRGVTSSEVVIGTYTDLSGVTAMWGVNNSNSWRMVFDQANTAGGIHGRKIKYIVEDNQYTPFTSEPENPWAR